MEPCVTPMKRAPRHAYRLPSIKEEALWCGDKTGNRPDPAEIGNVGRRRESKCPDARSSCQPWRNNLQWLPHQTHRFPPRKPCWQARRIESRGLDRWIDWSRARSATAPPAHAYVLRNPHYDEAPPPPPTRRTQPEVRVRVKPAQPKQSTPPRLAIALPDTTPARTIRQKTGCLADVAVNLHA